MKLRSNMEKQKRAESRRCTTKPTQVLSYCSHLLTHSSLATPQCCARISTVVRLQYVINRAEASCSPSTECSPKPSQFTLSHTNLTKRQKRRRSQSLPASQQRLTRTLRVIKWLRVQKGTKSRVSERPSTAKPRREKKEAWN